MALNSAGHLRALVPSTGFAFADAFANHLCRVLRSQDSWTTHTHECSARREPQPLLGEPAPARVRASSLLGSVDPADNSCALHPFKVEPALCWRRFPKLNPRRRAICEVFREGPRAGRDHDSAELTGASHRMAAGIGGKGVKQHAAVPRRAKSA
jgi:hypothetical protein